MDRDENMGKQLCYMCFDVLFVRDRQVHLAAVRLVVSSSLVRYNR